jgi:hypothetical protein
MVTKPTREELQASRKRWRLVRDRQREEELRLTVDERFRRLALLMRARIGMPDPKRATEEAEVRDRWQRLREIQLA